MAQDVDEDRRQGLGVPFGVYGVCIEWCIGVCVSTPSVSSVSCARLGALGALGLVLVITLDMRQQTHSRRLTGLGWSNLCRNPFGLDLRGSVVDLP